MGFTPHGYHKPTNAIHADSPDVYTSEENISLSTIDEIHKKCDVVVGSVANGKREPILFSFVLVKPSGYKIFCEPETLHYKKNKQICFEYYNILFRKR